MGPQRGSLEVKSKTFVSDWIDDSPICFIDHRILQSLGIIFIEIDHRYDFWILSYEMSKITESLIFHHVTALKIETTTTFW